ncbi:LAETG motif-containing sortase-dependent surface protein [Streptomyces cavernicola]|uniref:LAETG motif-containing sortase-dependent surface protein n=1 Tax=Streptomyces cavernicola TaxID=3043613 RepID=A0ABT6SBD5_9ACTN|nr:LAETG motif-containing sortase-dependent surface protein [Streptomyces sp. B-S-A6]MDI3405513.1 LAETG motif-containing sortase-dependent surface protein [Streptomyces sp. B-S-A6]
MKLRRVLATAAATAVIAPVALLAAPAAFATDGEPSPAPTATSPETSPSEEPSAEPTDPETTEPSEAPTETAPGTPAPTEEPTEAPTETDPEPTESEPTEEPTEEPTDEPTEPEECADSKVDVDIKGLPGKIAKGSGWHKFKMTVANNSDTTVKDLFFVAGASADKEGENVFKTRQVELQALNPETGAWERIGNDGHTAGFVGWTESLEPEYQVDIPLRLNVKQSAPVGAGFSLGGSVYSDEDAECVGFGQVAYKFQIVGAGTSTGGTEPQEGGKVPVPAEKPSKEKTAEVTGSLAETGSSSALPTIGAIGGITLVAGAGVVFAVKRRRGEGAVA